MILEPHRQQAVNYLRLKFNLGDAEPDPFTPSVVAVNRGIGLDNREDTEELLGRVGVIVGHRFRGSQPQTLVLLEADAMLALGLDDDQAERRAA